MELRRADEGATSLLFFFGTEAVHPMNSAKQHCTSELKRGKMGVLHVYHLRSLEGGHPHM